MQCDLLIFGSSGHAKVASDCARAAYPRQIMLGAEDRETTWRGIPVLPEAKMTLAEWKTFCPYAFVAIGDASRRELVTDRLEAAGFQLVTLRHPSAVVSDSALIGAGTLLCPGAIVNADARIGKSCIVNSAAVVEHESVLEDYVHLSPGAVVCGNALIGRKSWICAGAVVANGLSVGSDTIVGAGAAVIGDIPERVMAAGMPARIKKTYEGS